MYKRLNKIEFENFSKSAEEICKEKIQFYKQKFENAGISFKCTVKNAQRQYYDKGNKKIICMEILLYNSEQNYKVNSENSKKVCKYIYKFKKVKNTYYFKTKNDSFFDFIIKMYLKKAEKNGLEKFLKESVLDFFLRFFLPRRCGTFGDIFKGKDLMTIKIILAIIITLLMAVIRGLQEGGIYESYGW